MEDHEIIVIDDSDDEDDETRRCRERCRARDLREHERMMESIARLRLRLPEIDTFDAVTDRLVLEQTKPAESNPPQRLPVIVKLRGLTPKREGESKTLFHSLRA